MSTLSCGVSTVTTVTVEGKFNEGTAAGACTDRSDSPKPGCICEAFVVDDENVTDATEERVFEEETEKECD